MEYTLKYKTVWTDDWLNDKFDFNASNDQEARTTVHQFIRGDNKKRKVGDPHYEILELCEGKRHVPMQEGLLERASRGEPINLFDLGCI